MLVMALEGSKQMAEENRVITGYTIKNVTFHRPLIVTLDSEGAETQLIFALSEIHPTKARHGQNFEYVPMTAVIGLRTAEGISRWSMKKLRPK